MTESMLQSLMKLFALLATINVEASRIFSRNFVESYLKGQFSSRIVERSVSIFDTFMEELGSVKGKSDQKRIAVISVKILAICNQINKELHLKEKYMILFSIIQFSRHFQAHSNAGEDYSSSVQDAITTIAEALQINASEFNNSKAFITERFSRVPDKSALLVVSGLSDFPFHNVLHMSKDGLQGQFFFLHIRQAELYIFYYMGSEVVEMAGKNIFPNHIYVFPRGAVIKTGEVVPLYYSDIVSLFRRSEAHPEISYRADGIEILYPGSDNGVHELSVEFRQGEMVGIMGGSGAGKSTLINVMNGMMAPDKGTITINGFSLDPQDEAQAGLLGFVPQDDLLIEELTVFQNLYFNARLCLGDIEESEIIKRVGKTLSNLGLFDIKDLKVGSPLNKSISGGQRKRLNIALELIRESLVLFVDEPTSGLSSTDSENVLSLLKELSLTGKIVVVNIHQPSSEMYRQLDKLLLLDRGGYPVYYGHPLEAIGYLKGIAARADAEEIECACCGNIHTDDLLKIVEAKAVNEFGEYTSKRLYEPADWYRLYREKFLPEKKEPVKHTLPRVHFRIAGVISQFMIYSQRNLLSKIADRQYLILSILIAPLLALVLGYFTKYPALNEAGVPVYVFSLNENIPAYLFMSVIVSLFIGMIISAEEIIRDRKIRNREVFLSLSQYAYFNSKVFFLFGLSALQMLAYLLIGNLVLEIRGLNLNFWVILFSTSCFAVMLGLNISAGLKSVIAIYVVIPFVLVPLILLSGVIVQYDKLHPTVSRTEYVPLSGDFMASRWAYEALVVNQFMNNAYEKQFFENDMALANAHYKLSFLIPELLNHIDDLQHHLSEGNDEQAQKEQEILKNAFSSIENWPAGIDASGTPEVLIPLYREYLMQWRGYLVELYNGLQAEKDSVIAALERNGTDLVELKRRYHNERVEELVTNSNEMQKIVLSGSKLVRKDTPVFHVPDNRFGRAHFFAPVKRLGGFKIDTVKFNVMILWLMTLILYFALRYDLLRKLIGIFKKSTK